MLPRTVIVSQSLRIETNRPGLHDVTAAVADIVRATKIEDGLVNVFIRHTSASLVISENADPAVLRDLDRFLRRIAPEDPSAYEHDDEGPDDMPAHLRAALTRTSEQVPIRNGELLLGTWQAIYVWEHRHRAHTRELVVTVVGQ